MPFALPSKSVPSDGDLSTSGHTVTILQAYLNYAEAPDLKVSPCS